MSKNSITLKSRIKHYILNFICSFGKRKNEIILESYPDFSCNTYELFRYMLKNDFQKEYKLVWFMHDITTPHPDFGENVEFVEMEPSSIYNKFRTYYRKYNSRATISCNSFLPKFAGPKDQLHFFLDHGSQLKEIKRNGKRIGVDCDYYFCQSKFFVPYQLQEYDLNESQVVCTGLPRYDQLHRKNNNISKIIPEISKYSKVIIWVPTFRRHFDGNRVDCDLMYPYGVPVLYEKDDILQLLNILKKTNTLLIIKPHPAQDLSMLKEIDSSHLCFIYNDILQKNMVQLNEVLSQTDAMITDYSSIYYDYLELDKPIAITLDDYNNYDQQKGFVFDEPLNILKGEYIYSVDDLVDFIQAVAKNNDRKKESRNYIRSKINDFNDDKSTKRVFEFISKELTKQKGHYI